MREQIESLIRPEESKTEQFLCLLGGDTVPRVVSEDGVSVEHGMGYR